jgi:hypothetical protein
MATLQRQIPHFLVWGLVFFVGCGYLLFGNPQANSAQGDFVGCPGIISTALGATQTSCGNTTRNQLCYGHNLVQVEPQAFVSKLGFDLPGDTIPVARVRSVRGSALDINNATWGVALMRVQTSLPDALPNQNATFLLFGDAEITDSTTRDITNLTMTSTSATNIRTGPAVSYPILNSSASGENVIATGRLADNSWLRVWIPQQEGRMGWVYGSLVSPTTGDLASLAVIDPGAGTPSLGALDAFYLKTNDDATTECAQLPKSGLLIQTPEGVGTIRLYINEVKMDIGSTVFFQAKPNGDLTVSTIEGMAVVESANHTEAAAAGSQLTVPLGDDLKASGAPTEPVPYDQTQFENLPLAELQRSIQVAPPLSPEAIRVIHDRVQSNQPLCGVEALHACSTITIEGNIQAIDADTITVNNMTVAVAANDPIRSVLAFNVRVHVEGNLDQSGTRLIPTKIILLPFIPALGSSNASGASNGNQSSAPEANPSTGQVWNDPGDCSHAPPPWAPAYGWRQRCEGGSGNSGDNGMGNGNGNGNGNGMGMGMGG